MHYRPSALQGDRPTMSIKGKAYIVGIYEHPTRKADDKSLAQLHAESAKGALEDAGLTRADVDGYFCAGDAPGLGPLSMTDYLGLKLRHMDSTDSGGSSYIIHVGHAAEAIAAGKCSVALITLAGRPRSSKTPTVRPPRTCTRCARCATCTSTGRRASSSPGSRSRPRIMLSTIRTRCCATSSRSKMSSIRR